jgi:hypothetical protein
MNVKLMLLRAEHPGLGGGISGTGRTGRTGDAATERFVEEWRSATGGWAACADDGELEPS